jgi:hypothetical protein
LDKRFEEEVKVCLKVKASSVRFTDDAVLIREKRRRGASHGGAAETV